ncbi:hypothetical protein [Flavobacterium granuli]|uniref:PAP2 superfamily protein n=1 Tax=Flavobacterium granuli TaxID=280093 RepID=A0A1M5TCU8_9FLAO|nr:hypothetical protein [Flavobacterium granuli]PRZ20319.1 hypothetical protein BC624_1128 [Flavobacterium granuli]SHH48538.1 hypothetical protein SAMN05443373_1148 [Flavobacterium granuli]
MKKLLPPFSYIFHPIFIPIYATLFYLFANDSYFVSREKYVVLIQVFIISFIIPILFFFLLRYTGKISSTMAPDLSERKIPLVIQCFLIILLVRKSITIDRYPELHFFFLGALLSTMIALLLLFVKTKASLHMMGISGLTLFVFGLSLHYHTQHIYTIAFLILMNGLVASSRIEMKAHTIKELIIGLLLGSIPQMLLLYLWL